MEMMSPLDGRLELYRYPRRHNDPLRAWDAADEYLLNHLMQHQHPPNNRRLVIVNDGFGALACALAAYRPLSVSDSFVAHQATVENLKGNGLPAEQVNCLDSLHFPDGPYHLVLIKVPKSLALLEDQLYRLREHITPDTVILGAGMVKSIHRSTLELFETILGPTTTSLAQKKARLIFCRPHKQGTAADSPYPIRYHLEEYGLQVSNHANVFSRQRLDIGSRFFLEHIHELPAADRIIDLGCGNGVLGILAARQHPEARLLFADESYMAVESARINFEHAFGERTAEFAVTNCLDGVPSSSADLVLNNPPFHQQQAVGDHIAWQMFQQAKQVLVPGGQLWVVGNRHLGYHAKLKRLFGSCDLVASNRKFVLLRAVCPG